MSGIEVSSPLKTNTIILVMILLFGCSTFQTAEVLAPKEDVLGYGLICGIPEIYYRRGLTSNMDIGIKTDVWVDGDLFPPHLVTCVDLKYQILREPIALSTLIGVGVPIGIQELIRFYPSIIAGTKHLYFGVRPLLGITEGLPAGMVGYAFGPSKRGRSLMVEFNLYYIYDFIIPVPAIAYQRELRSRK